MPTYMRNLFLTVAIHLLCSTTSTRVVWGKYEVHVIDGILDDPNPVHVHCKSKDDDLGTHDLRANDDFHWRFGLNLFGGTHFTCYFAWRTNVQNFAAFDQWWAYKCAREHRCYWLVKPDGFYFSNYLAPWLSGDWKKEHDWASDSFEIQPMQ
ncbi:hypothetical protein RJ639_002322 [Escallonia herrerae]|uniref:S-protein homolog n=1 Tax=Escallonia herrerae TaxID=1293975 RepID=A0AA89BRI0_9ASTE|nr:hypothetical protein RJ639_002322 [Escallonia herrerae]